MIAPRAQTRRSDGLAPWISTVRDLALLALGGWLIWQPRSRIAPDQPQPHPFPELEREEQR